MSEVKPKAAEFPTWRDVKMITSVAAIALALLAIGKLAGHNSDGFVLVVAALLLATLHPWSPR